jgi:hypothetical protein
MSGRAKYAVFFACFATLSACSLFVSLDGLSESPRSNDGDAGQDALADTSSASDAAVDAADGSNEFIDDFNRPDAMLIGNGWIEKNTNAFTLSSDEVLRTSPPDQYDYVDDVVYRPQTEDITNSEISIELVFPSAVAGYPQIHSRIQSNTIATVGTTDSYLFYIPNSAKTANISRTRGQENLNDFASATLSPPMVPGDRYRLRLSVSGANPVFLYGVVEHQSGSDWVMIGQVSAQDSDPSLQLDDAGSVGFSTSNDPGIYAYDNFTHTPL